VASDAVVLVRAELNPDVMLCSGVVIARTLVITALGCVTRPANVGDPTEAAGPGGAQTVRSASVAYDRVCEHGASWSPLEDGSFSARWGKPVEASHLSVYRPGEPANAVQSVVTSGSASRCADGIALLVLERPASIQPAAVYLDPLNLLDPAVTLSGHCISSSSPIRRELSSRIQAITSASGNEMAPPRSLALQHSVSTFDVGGGVLSPDGSTLLAILASGSDDSCETQDPDGSSIAIQLAFFRHMLLDVAAQATETLRVSPAPESGWSAPLDPCSDLPDSLSSDAPTPG
jgi:hypothetical protein